MLRYTRPYFWRFLDQHWEAVSSCNFGSEYLAVLSTIPKPAQHLVTCTWCHAEVCNGGFHQYFGNYTGMMAPEAVKGFQAMGASELAIVVRDAMAVFGAVFPRDAERRCKVLENYARRHPRKWNPFEKADASFYACLEPVGLTDRWEDLANDYAKKNRREMV